MKSIAIIRLSSLGDIIQSAIILQFIKKNFKSVKITWFVDEEFKEILKFANSLDEVVALPLKKKEFLKSYEILKAYKNKFDLVLDPQGLIKSSIVAKILASKVVVGYYKNSIKEPLASIFYNKKLEISYNENIIIRNLELASFALDFKYNLLDILNKKKIFKSKKENFTFLKKNRLKNILIAPFSSDESKNYASFYEVVNGVGANFYILSLGEEQKERAKNIAGDKGVVLNNLKLEEILNLMELMDLVVGNDSGITHLAWAQNRPSITLFGNRPAKRNTFITKTNLIIDAKKEIDAKKIDKNDYCINSIDPKEIIKLVKSLIK